jgi:uncharacterized RDD family membrane protein YckC
MLQRIHRELAVVVLKSGWVRLSPMSDKPQEGRRRFHAHVSAHVDALNGLVLASFWQRLLGYFVDLVIAVAIWFPVELCWRYFLLHEVNVHLVWDFHEAGNVIVMVLYWGLTVYFGNGRTPGKWVARTRIVSLTGPRMGLWQSIERGLGYGASVLEGGLGFLQFFWDRNRMCAQDRLAETIVVDARELQEGRRDCLATAGLKPESSAWSPPAEIGPPGS